MASGAIERLTAGIHRWTAPHPEWRTSHPWGHDVACYALETEDATVLVDPLAPSGEQAGLFWAELDELVEQRGVPIAVLITIHYHVRSAAEVAARYGGDRPVEIWAHPAIERRLPRTVDFHPVRPGEPLPGGGRAFAIGSPRRQEQPLHFPSLRALVFGDSIVGATAGSASGSRSRASGASAGTATACCPRSGRCSISRRITCSLRTALP